MQTVKCKLSLDGGVPEKVEIGLNDPDRGKRTGSYKHTEARIGKEMRVHDPIPNAELILSDGTKVSIQITTFSPKPKFTSNAKDWPDNIP